MRRRAYLRPGPKRPTSASMRNLTVTSLLSTLFMAGPAGTPGAPVLAQGVAVQPAPLPSVPVTPAAPIPPAATHSELQTQVEALLESGPFAIQGANIAYPSIVYAFYAQRGFQPAWTNAH